MNTETEKEPRCLRCDKDISNLRKNTKFCSDKCRTSYNSYHQYRRNKDNPEFKARAKARFERWRQNNRERFNELAYAAMKRMKARKELEKRGRIVE